MTLFISIVAAVSLIINGVLVWYARLLARQFLFFTQNVAALEEALSAFGEHLSGVHELEMFYGDDTLDGLLRHSKAIVEEIGDFYEGFSLEAPEEKEGEDGSA